MKTGVFLTLLGFIGLINKTKSQCDLSGRKEDKEFPDIFQNVDSYMMGVEYTIPGAKQTDYYTEFYEDSKKRGRVESHISGEIKQYIYQSKTWEAWTLHNRKCDLKNITEIPDFLKDAQTDWLHYTGGERPTTIGPSAMFKIAYDVWKTQGQNMKIAYMGTKERIRGETAVYWRRCINDKSYVDYYFADESQINPFDKGADKDITPLRVAFYGLSEITELSGQFYDIIKFQHSIPAGIQPFDLPKGRNCRRGKLVDGLPLPDFSTGSLHLSAEVIYKRYAVKDYGYDLTSSYYNTLTFALDRETNHLAYYYAFWKKDKEDGKPIADVPNCVIYDMFYAYAYRINFDTSKCVISREKSFIPQYRLPEEGGSLSLTDPYVLFPNDELTYLSSGTERGLAVDIFEAEIRDYVLDRDNVIPRVIVSHSYLKSNEKLENTVVVKNAPVQIELRFFRTEKIVDVLTLNIFGFTTRLTDKQNLFDLRRCFNNDYSFLTIGFEVASPYLTQIENKLPQIEASVLSEVTLKSYLNAVRIPTTMTDMKSNMVFVNMLILEKPPLQLDFPDIEEDKTISVASAGDTLGIASFETCADSCLEERNDCWGFSSCGATCYFGSTTNTKIEDKTECTLYRRYKNDTFMPSKNLQIADIVRQVEVHEFKIAVSLDNDKLIQLTAAVAKVTDPAEDDKIENKPNPRMKVFKAATKLKKGSEIKNLGKLRYDECQRLCLDFKNCETMSYCLTDGQCLLNSKYSSDLKLEDMEVNDFCTVLTRKYRDHFDRTPGVFVKTSGGIKKDLTNMEDCASLCLKEKKFKCLSFDHCPREEKGGCTLYTTRYLNVKTREAAKDEYPGCGHYARKFSDGFKIKEETRIVGSKVPPILNVTLEECAKSCFDYGQGACYGYDFCQDNTLLATSCTLFDSDPSFLKSSYSAICTNYVRPEEDHVTTTTEEDHVTTTTEEDHVTTTTEEDHVNTTDRDFPDILQTVADSYIMGVEYTTSGAKQTDYYTEYYDMSFKRGRVDSHIKGENKKYIYESETWEAWTLENLKCDLQNITDTPDFFKDDQTDWLHYTGGEQPTTVGPSAMFKTAYDVWKNQGKNRKMKFMGTKEGIRGETAIYWRRFIDDKNYVDYYFAEQKQQNPFDSDDFKVNITPLRVAFHGTTSAEEKELSTQFYDIISFQHYIPAGVEPFDLPKGLNCQRGDLVDGPVLPDFSGSSLLLSAEVIYQKFDTENNRRDVLTNYYSTLMFALDREINHLGYYFSSWTKEKDEDGKPIPDPPHYIIYDMLHAYAYRINYETSKCEISREKQFIPQYKLPEDGGSLGLTDPYVLFPNNELSYLSSGTHRGLAVNIYEAEIKDYVLDKDNVIPRVIATHSYLKTNEKLENTVEVRNAPTQIQLRFFRKENIEEMLTFNIFGFTTRLPDKKYFFDVTSCFKNDDDYSFLTIGFEVDTPYVSQIVKKLPEIEANVLNEITLKSELNAVRIPTTMTDMKSNIVYVTMLILGKPPLQLDFPDKEEDKSISVASEDDTLGMASFEVCAASCLEERNDCWGFSWCGATCYFGSTTNTKVEDKLTCTLYRRYKNETFMPSKDLQINNIMHQVEAGEFRTMVTLDNDERIELKATEVQVTDPAEDDTIFDKMGNKLNPRMKVFKAATKLKKGSNIKNLGKLRYEECQSLCLDFKDCETMSYCLINGQCLINSKYSSDLKTEDMEEDDLCNVLTRKYTDHFDRTPGVFVKGSGGTDKDLTTEEDCARACLKKEKCLSFDHCAGQEKKGCTLYTTHYLNLKSNEQVMDKNPSCGHYTRKFSGDFKKKEETRIVGSKVPPILNLTLEECAKSCIDYGEGACYGYDFCQDKTLFATSCTLFDSDPSRLQSSYSSICTNYVRTQAEYAPHPYTTSYAGGIGFLCFLIGGFLGAVIVFVIRYIRGNKQEFSDTVLTSNRISSKERRNSMPKDSLSAL